MAGVFISYRRSDSAGHTGRLASDLGEGLDEQQLFRDIEAIEAGEDFVDALNRAVSACSVMLVVIGPSWARVETGDGKRRLMQPGDFVRMEIEAALAGQVRVIPVLVGEAQMPQPEDLPESMQPLLRRNAYSISDRRWQYDVDQLLDILAKIPGIASRTHKDIAAPAPAVAVPPAKSGMSTGMKVGIGSGIALVVILALLMIGGGDASTSPETSSSSAAPATTSAAAQPVPTDAGSPGFVGVWRTDDQFYYSILQEGDSLTVVSGESIDPTKPPVAAGTAPTAAGIELVGKATVDGPALEVTLVDSFSNETETLILMLSEDGQILEGTIHSSGNPNQGKIVLRRL